MKKTTTIKLDENLLLIAKKEIPNLSKFFEDCLREYLTIEDEDLKEIQSELNKIREAKLKIHLLTEHEDNNKRLMDFEGKTKNNIWSKIWRTYRNNGEISENDMLQVYKLLGKNPEEIENMINTLLMFCNKQELLECDAWSYAEQKYENLK